MGPRSDFSKPCQGAAEKSANATRCCCLARGFQCVGMSTVEAVNRKISWLFCFISHGCTVSARFFARSVFSMSDDVGRCIALQSVPFSSGEQCQAQLCLHFRVGILEQFQKVPSWRWWVRLRRVQPAGWRCRGLAIEAAKLLPPPQRGGVRERRGCLPPQPPPRGPPLLPPRLYLEIREPKKGGGYFK